MIFEVLFDDFLCVIIIGCFDLIMEGLFFFINDGDLVCMFELLSIGWVWWYRVWVYGKVIEVDFEKFIWGVEVEGFKYGFIEVFLDK